MELLVEKMMNEDAISDYKADAEIQPKRRGRAAKPVEPPAEVTLVVEEAPAAPAEPEPYMSPQTRLEIEAGRKAIGLDN